MNEDTVINKQLEATIDEAGEYYYHMFYNIVNGNNDLVISQFSNKCEPRIAFKHVFNLIIQEMIK